LTDPSENSLKVVLGEPMRVQPGEKISRKVRVPQLPRCKLHHIERTNQESKEEELKKVRTNQRVRRRGIARERAN